MSSKKDAVHQRFVRALQHETLSCGLATCPGPVETTELSQLHDRVKSFQAECRSCGWKLCIAGQEQTAPPWDEASLLQMADEHLMHQPPLCPYDHTPIVFTSLPNPRRKARYRLSCYYCGRQADMDWPPSASRR
ncbi:MAG: hypothetical protein ACT4OO_05265 [Nitrospiraceae bacterium]